jgi:hypothetical protein
VPLKTIIFICHCEQVGLNSIAKEPLDGSSIIIVRKHWPQLEEVVTWLYLYGNPTYPSLGNSWPIFNIPG